ncbi:MAG TPA: aminotransferase class V-fold PLP-dependent enzyme [Gemmatimonadaceae bacterium]|nr:aminotransferase class V-fold PLP-dependent enzyme [Gemmatimonadaceae bacterium]
MSFDVAAVRAAEFAAVCSEGAIFLNNASTGPYPKRTVQTLEAFTRLRAAPHLIGQDLQFATLTRSRELAASLIGASSDEIALATNTSFGITLAAMALPLAAGDVVLGAQQEFPANVYPWMDLARRRGVEYRLLPLHDGVPSQEELIAALDNDRVRVVAISWVEFASGYRFDLAAVGRACRERGIFLIVDGIQGLGAATLDVRACHVDVFACGAQKWLLSPWGSGFVYVRRELIQALDPPVVSWMSVRGSDDFTRLVDYDLTWRDDARRFELVTLPYQDFAGMNASLELIFELGPAAIEAYVGGLADIAVDWALSRDDVVLVTPSDPRHRAGIVSVCPKDPLAASRRLAQARVSHSLREGAIRLSPHFHNTAEEMALALTILDRG